MNKKTLFSLVGAASIAVSLSATAPVLAAETTNLNPTSTTTNNTADQKGTTTNTPSTGQTSTTDTSKTPTTIKRVSTSRLIMLCSLKLLSIK